RSRSPDVSGILTGEGRKLVVRARARVAQRTRQPAQLFLQRRVFRCPRQRRSARLRLASRLTRRRFWLPPFLFLLPCLPIHSNRNHTHQSTRELRHAQAHQFPFLCEGKSPRTSDVSPKGRKDTRRADLHRPPPEFPPTSGRSNPRGDP